MTLPEERIAPTPDPVEVLTRLPLFKDLPREAVQAFLGLARWEEHPAGASLAEEGTPCTDLWLIVKGRVAGTLGDGHSMLLVMDAREGELLGTVGLYRKNATHPIRLTLVEPCTLIRFDTDTVIRLSSMGNPVGNAIEDSAIQALTRRVRGCNDAISEALRPTGGFSRAFQKLRGLLGG